mmetsp:Transcript_7832/g.19206  ORF Transcript_7832/g.19206 Transcript_7832/m.19206 type:complete len:447 (-) Transcript_7832:65-1405(-)
MVRKRDADVSLHNQSLAFECVRRPRGFVVDVPNLILGRVVIQHPLLVLHHKVGHAAIVFHRWADVQDNPLQPQCHARKAPMQKRLFEVGEVTPLARLRHSLSRGVIEPLDSKPRHRGRLGGCVCVLLINAKSRVQHPAAHDEAGSLVASVAVHSDDVLVMLLNVRVHPLDNVAQNLQMAGLVVLGRVACHRPVEARRGVLPVRAEVEDEVAGSCKVLVQGTEEPGDLIEVVVHDPLAAQRGEAHCDARVCHVAKVEVEPPFVEACLFPAEQHARSVDHFDQAKEPHDPTNRHDLPCVGSCVGAEHPDEYGDRTNHDNEVEAIEHVREHLESKGKKAYSSLEHKHCKDGSRHHVERVVGTRPPQTLGEPRALFAVSKARKRNLLVVEPGVRVARGPLGRAVDARVQHDKVVQRHGQVREEEQDHEHLGARGCDPPGSVPAHVAHLHD